MFFVEKFATWFKKLKIDFENNKKILIYKTFNHIMRAVDVANVQALNLTEIIKQLEINIKYFMNQIFSRYTHSLYIVE